MEAIYIRSPMSGSVCLLSNRKSNQLFAFSNLYLPYLYDMAWPVVLSSMNGNPVMSFFSQASPEERMVYACLGLAAYLGLISSLRFQRQKAIHQKYPYKTRESMSRMTDHDAFAIQKTILQTEFPFIVLKSLQFALFRVRQRPQL